MRDKAAEAGFLRRFLLQNPLERPNAFEWESDGMIDYAAARVSHATSAIDPFQLTTFVAYLALSQPWSLPLPRSSDQAYSPHSTSSPTSTISKTAILY